MEEFNFILIAILIIIVCHLITSNNENFENVNIDKDIANIVLPEQVFSESDKSLMVNQAVADAFASQARKASESVLEYSNKLFLLEKKTEKIIEYLPKVPQLNEKKIKEILIEIEKLSTEGLNASEKAAAALIEADTAAEKSPANVKMAQEASEQAIKYELIGRTALENARNKVINIVEEVLEKVPEIKPIIIEKFKI